MNAAYVSAIAALAGSAIGALASFATSWLTQSYQDRTQRMAQESTRRERLFGEFIDEASRLFADAMTRNLVEPDRMVKLYATIGKLRLFASEETIRRAQEVMSRIIETYHRPNPDFEHLGPEDSQDLDMLRDFTSACRRELR